MSPLITGLVSSVASMIFKAATAGSVKPQVGAGKDEQAPAPSTFLHLSPEAESLAGLAGKGVAIGRGNGAPMPAGVAAGGAQGRSVSREDFQALLERFGATNAQKEALAAGFDTNNDGRIGQDEFLKGLSKTQGAQAGTDFSQTLLQLMDRAGNANGIVSQEEFITLTTAFSKAQGIARHT